MSTANPTYYLAEGQTFSDAQKQSLIIVAQGDLVAHFGLLKHSL